MKYGSPALVAASVVMWWLEFFPTYVLAVLAAFWAVVVMFWLAAWVTKILVAPILKIFLDIFRYVSDPEYRDRIQRGLDERIAAERAISRHQFVLLAHSLGTVIAADSLVNSRAWGPEDRVVLITMGSPLRRFFFRFLPELFFPASADAVGDAAAARLRDFRWANVYRPWDQVGARLGLTKRGSMERSTGQWRRFLTAHPNYWSDKAVRVRAKQVISDLPGWPPNPHRPPANPIIPDQLNESGAGGLAAYWAMASVLLLATVVAFVVSSGTSKALYDESFAQERAALERRGVTADATVVHRLESQVVSEPVTKVSYNEWSKTWETKIEHETKTLYIDHFEFQFTPQGGAEVTKEVRISDEWNDHERFFDPESLERAIAAKGEALGPMGKIETKVIWPDTIVMLPPEDPGRRLRHVRLVYLPDRLADLDAMRVLLPDHPPQPLTSKNVSDWMEIAGNSLIVLGVGFAVLWGGYFCFLYFLGRNQKFGRLGDDPATTGKGGRARPMDGGGQAHGHPV